MSRRTSGINNIDALKNVDEQDISTEPTETKDNTTEVTTKADDNVAEETEESGDVKTDAYTKTIGIISDCQSLNIRHEATTDSEVVSVLRSGSEVIIYDDGSTEEFYKICTSAGVDGYCMKQYITIK